MTTQQEQERALAEMEERDLQADCEETAAEESRGRPLTVAGFEAALAASSSADSSMKDAEAAVQTTGADLASAIIRADSVLRNEFEEIEPPGTRRRSSVAGSANNADRTFLAQQRASRQRDRAEPWFRVFKGGP